MQLQYKSLAERKEPSPSSSSWSRAADSCMAGFKNVLLSWSICILTPLLLVLFENDSESTWRPKNQNQHYSREEGAEVDLTGNFQYLWGGYQNDWALLFTVMYGRRGWGLWAEVETIEIPVGIGKNDLMRIIRQVWLLAEGLNKNPNYLILSYSWPSFEQEVGRKASQAPFQLTVWYCEQ